MRVVFLAGAGGVGKTSVIDLIKELEPSVQIMPSISRSVYAKMGIATEQAAMGMSDEERQTFQSLILDTYIEEVYKTVMQAYDRGEKYFVVDRSPFDHVSYQTYILPNLSLQQIKDLETKAQRFYRELTLVRKGEVRIEAETILFPFPTPWTTDRGSFDEVRYAPDAKNLAWHCLLDHFLKSHAQKGLSVRELRSVTPKGRAYEVLNALIR